MPANATILRELGLEHLLEDGTLAVRADGPLAGPAGQRLVAISAEAIRALHHVLERERAGAWRAALKSAGHYTGRKLGEELDARLAALGQPALAALPLEACLALVERHFAACGWGRLQLDLTDAADYGLVVARLEHSAFVEALPAVDDFVDALPAGLLQGFFEYISGQTLGCEEIACGRRGAARCTFVITAPDRLATVMPRLGQESAEAILAALRQ